MKVPPFDFATEAAMTGVPLMHAVLKAVPMNRGGRGAVAQSRFQQAEGLAAVLFPGGRRRGTFDTLGPTHRHRIDEAEELLVCRDVRLS